MESTLLGPQRRTKLKILKILKLIWSNQLSIVNEWAQIHSKGDDKIALVGVENWGISKASDINNEGFTKDEFKILMSHDPSHWIWN
jgi:hypothetical protein